MATSEDAQQAQDPQTRCVECGGVVAGGLTGCQTLLHDLALRAYSDPRYGAVYDLVFDAFCMQHIEPYCHSAKSYAAHLTRLCCGIEYDGDPAIYRAIQQWLNGARLLEKPSVLHDRGAITVADVMALPVGDEQIKLLHLWPANVWKAYGSQQDLARSWIRAVLGEQTEAKHEKARRRR